MSALWNLNMTIRIDWAEKAAAELGADWQGGAYPRHKSGLLFVGRHEKNSGNGSWQECFTAGTSGRLWHKIDAEAETPQAAVAKFRANLQQVIDHLAKQIAEQERQLAQYRQLAEAIKEGE